MIFSQHLGPMEPQACPHVLPGSKSVWGQPHLLASVVSALTRLFFLLSPLLCGSSRATIPLIIYAATLWQLRKTDQPLPFLGTAASQRPLSPTAPRATPLVWRLTDGFLWEWAVYLLLYLECVGSPVSRKPSEDLQFFLCSFKPHSFCEEGWRTCPACAGLRAAHEGIMASSADLGPAFQSSPASGETALQQSHG